MEPNNRVYAGQRIIHNKAYYGTQSPLSNGTIKQGKSTMAAVRTNLLTKIEQGTKMTFESERNTMNDSKHVPVSTNKKLTSVPYTLSKENNSRRYTMETTLVSPKNQQISQINHRSTQHSQRSTHNGHQT
jgi:hypothetical protein